MGKKNRDLCERPYCRERWQFRVSGFDSRFGGRGWTLRVCAYHAEPYQHRDEAMGAVCTLSPRPPNNSLEAGPGG